MGRQLAGFQLCYLHAPELDDTVSAKKAIHASGTLFWAMRASGILIAHLEQEKNSPELTAKVNRLKELLIDLEVIQ